MLKSLTAVAERGYVIVNFPRVTTRGPKPPLGGFVFSGGPMTDEVTRLRVRVYFDGFNFYVGAFTNGRGGPSVRAPYKWLDLHAFCRDVLPDSYEIDLIRYFTTPASEEPGNGKRKRQAAYFSALESTGVQIHPDGVFRRRRRMMKLAVPKNHSCGRTRVEVTYREEKRADVNLATWLLLDCFDQQFDVAVIVSDDTDLAGAIKAVRERFGKEVAVINIRHRDSIFDGDVDVEVYPAARKKFFVRNQLPATICLDDGTHVSCPAEWRSAEEASAEPEVA